MIDPGVSSIDPGRRNEMLRNTLGSICAVWLVVACASDVDVGGPRLGDGGESAGRTPNEMLEEQPKTAREYAQEQAACATDADCCVVVDDCQNAAYVVGSARKAATEQAISASYDPNRCTLCIAPLVQVSCEDGKCIGSEVDYAEAGEVGLQLSETHCGTIQGPQPSTAHDSVFGCGSL
jgi:hypothetical protein